MTIIQRLRDAAARLFPRRVIGSNDDPYLERYYVLGRYPRHYWPKNTVEPRLPWLPFSVYLHRFERPDMDIELHNHPFKWALSLILAGGYVEKRIVTGEYRDGLFQIKQHWAEWLTRWKNENPLVRHYSDSGLTVATRTMLPGMINVIGQNTFHKVTSLRRKSVWTLFVTGRKASSWGFKNPRTGVFEHWREHHARQRLASLVRNPNPEGKCPLDHPHEETETCLGLD